ncbi:hypothetical protein AgCh_002304 [Apium graveolens]
METVEHILCSCDLATQCWQRVLVQVSFNENTRFQEWWGRVLDIWDREKQAEVATVCWSLWKARNELVWNKYYTRVNVVIAKAKQYLLQWNIAQKNKSHSHYPYLMEGDGNEVWVAPKISFMKISVDAAIFSEYNASGLGVIARDNRGELTQAITKCNFGLISAIMAEAIAVKEALRWLKSESLTVVQAIRSKVLMRSPFGQVIQCCCDMLQDLNTVSLFFVKRTANMTAHELARLSYYFPDRVFDRFSIPIDVNNVLMSELRY